LEFSAQQNSSRYPPISRAAAKLRRQDGACATRIEEGRYYILHYVCSHLSPVTNHLDLTAQYLDKKVFVQLNGSRKVVGVVRGYDVFLNIVLDDAFEEKDGGEKVKLGMVVRGFHSLSPPPDRCRRLSKMRPR
jgi:small nuclear ribonucleoprotein (snRNP)-like protein